MNEREHLPFEPWEWIAWGVTFILALILFSAVVQYQLDRANESHVTYPNVCHWTPGARVPTCHRKHG